MVHIPNIVPVSDLRQGAADLLDQIKKTGEPVVITQRGRASVVMISIDRYERDEHERELLRRIAQGEQEILRGKGHTLADVLSDADRILRK